MSTLLFQWLTAKLSKLRASNNDSGHISSSSSSSKGGLFYFIFAPPSHSSEGIYKMSGKDLRELFLLKKERKAPPSFHFRSGGAVHTFARAPDIEVTDGSVFFLQYPNTFFVFVFERQFFFFFFLVSYVLFITSGTVRPNAQSSLQNPEENISLLLCCVCL